MPRIGILGGSFDPIHQGHIEIALCAQNCLKLDQVLWIPAARSPFKQEKEYGVSDADRLTMTRLAIEALPDFRVSSWELEQGGVSYTVDTLRHFKQQEPESTFFLLMGEDTYQQLEHWKSPGEIQQLARIVVAPRRDESFRLCQKIPPGKDNEGPYYLNMPLCDASSTQLRVDLGSAQREAALAKLPGPVQRYIRKHELYQ